MLASLRQKVERESSAEILFRIKRDLEGAASYRWMVVKRNRFCVASEDCWYRGSS
jgi:hypothetical protein